MNRDDAAVDGVVGRAGGAGLDDIRARVEALMRKDRRNLHGLVNAIARREREGRPATKLAGKLDLELGAAETRLAARRATGYRLDYPEALPVSSARGEILAALAAHRVIVVCGDTGSGKTTQLPKICLEAGRGIFGMIGHTQPRRIAARAVAARVAEELGVELGGAVGYQVRFTDETQPSTLIKVMTDGILLNEIREDRWLDAYDTLIIDEAHERSLNIDFLLGYLQRIAERRPDLKVIVTSATIDPERFAAHFGGAPILRVEGRAHPVDLRYRPVERDLELAEAVTSAAVELAHVDLATIGGGSARDILAFLPGERWIRDAERELKRAGPKGYEVLPLYARLTAARQQRIFHPGGTPRIVLATNVAETSLTVPRIRFVIDSGLARVGRYSPRHRLQTLGVEPIAQANAVQRSGRCGRIAPGICVRLYDEADFDARPAFMEPEILRTNLAGVILKLEAFGLGRVEAFPFIEAPPTRAVNDAYRLLELLGALGREQSLTPDGDLMARLPLDPRLARLLVSAHRLGALKEGLVLAAALGVIDPREQPPDRLGEARQRHAELADPKSDFATLLELWRLYGIERRRGERALRKWCEERFLSRARLREWEDVHHQLRELTRGLGWRASAQPAEYEAVHRAVLSAFLDFVAEKTEDGLYEGIHGAKATLFPGSGLAKARPRWVVAAERVATERVYLRTLAQVKPGWIEDAAAHLLKREYLDPHWDRKRGRVLAREVVTFHGLTLSRERYVEYQKVDPAAARELFIRCALAEDDFGDRPPAVVKRNRRLLYRLHEWEARRRSRDLYAGPRAVEAFYVARLPERIADRGAFVDWCRKPDNAARLAMDVLDIATRDPAEFDRADYPDTLDVAGHALELDYVFEPASVRDGINLRVPAPLVGVLRDEQIDWLVPGRLPAKVLMLLRGLPKDLRRPLVPLPDAAERLVARIADRRGIERLVPSLRDALAVSEHVDVGDALERVELPREWCMRIEVLDREGQVIAAERDLVPLQRRFASGRAPRRSPAGARRGRGRTAAASDAAVDSATGSDWAKRGITRWDIGSLPPGVEVHAYGTALALYPALLDADGRVDLELLPPGAAAEARHRAGVRRLLLRQLAQQSDLVRRRVLEDRALVLSYHGLGTGDGLADDVLSAAADEAFELSPPIRDPAHFEAQLERGRSELVPAAERLIVLAKGVLERYRALARQIEAGGVSQDLADDLSAQLDALVGPRFLSDTPPRWRAHLPRYLSAALQRVEKRSPKDAERAAIVQRATAVLEAWRQRQPPDWPWPAAIVDYRFLLEELRVSLFAQNLGTAQPVSAKRLEEHWQRAITPARRNAGS